MPMMIIQRSSSGAPMANKPYRVTHASIPTANIHFTPSRAKKNGITIMKKISEIWPYDMVVPMGNSTCSTTRLAIW